MSNNNNNETIKTRCFPEKNYKAIWLNGKTLRLTLDNTKPIEELDYPEFYDIAIGNKCFGRCKFCYADSKTNGKNFKNIVKKIRTFFGTMDDNQKPFQVAIGGAGEPTLHPKFIETLEAFKELDIVPNYTTNGMFINEPCSEEIIQATKKYCGGVAISCHPHLDHFWKAALAQFASAGIRTNVHIIISDKESVERFAEIYNQYKTVVEYFVLLPHTAQGRAEPKLIDWPALRVALEEKIENQKQIAFGANFYPYLVKDGKGLDVSLYEPEIMSKYITLEGNGFMYKSSFADMNKPIKTNLWCC